MIKQARLFEGYKYLSSAAIKSMDQFFSVFQIPRLEGQIDEHILKWKVFNFLLTYFSK